MNIRKHIPNIITCGNLFCGCLAIVKTFEGDLVWAAYLVGIAAVLDFLDGAAARLLNVHSQIGRDLDSLADMVTFGVVPGVIMFKLILLSKLAETGLHSSVPDISAISTDPYYPAYIAFAITIFSCIRLAKFNNDPRQSDSFIGLPTPANSILIGSFPLILQYNSNVASWFMTPFLLCLLSFILSLMLVSEIPLFSLKFKDLKWPGNQLRYVFLGLSLILLITLQFVGIPLVIILYILLSYVNNIFLKKKV